MKTKVRQISTHILSEVQKQKPVSIDCNFLKDYLAD